MGTSIDSSGAVVDRIAVLPAALADQIAAGEVVERPASVVKELVENAVDAGATRVEVELAGAGMASIRVLDDGRGIHPEDLPLAVRRHATSKISTADELVEIRTLGFRGEALASICAVARTSVRSRARGAPIGHELAMVPGEAPVLTPVGMPEGTQVEVAHLFAAVPARRKFVRSEATEVGHCSDAVTRVALVHPDVHFSLRHEGRKLLDLPRTDAAGRMTQILERRGPGPFFEVEGERDGVRVQAFLGPPSSATRQRKGTFITVRRRVVAERSISQILHAAYADALPSGLHPVAGISVEPPRGSVDVNVHPQKAEVRFADAQAVYAAVRGVLAEGLRGAPWVESDWVGPDAASDQRAARIAQAAEATAGEGWDFSAVSVPRAPGATSSTTGSGGASSSYRLGTRATQPGYARVKADARDEVEDLRGRLALQRGGPSASPQGMAFASPAGGEANDVAAVDPMAGLELLTCLPGPVALFRRGPGILVVDLSALRAYLVRRRLERDLGGQGIVSQRLLTPAVVALAPDEVAACVQGGAVLLELGIELEAFGDDSVIVRGVPAHVERCVVGADVEDLLHRVLPWLKLRQRKGADAAPHDRVIDAMAGVRPSQASPAADEAPRSAGRLARQWIKDLLEVDGPTALDEAPCVRAYCVSDLLGPVES